LDVLVEDSSDKPKRKTPQKIKRRVVRKGFYSDEEDGSTEEEVYANAAMGNSLTLANALRDRSAGGGISGGVDMTAYEDDQLHEDHRMFLRSSLPLLKSRNSGVVLSVCSLHYYCGVASPKVRSALGKALVRIHRNRREIQFVVLASIRTLVTECPSAFTPFLNDFFITVRKQNGLISTYVLLGFFLIVLCFFFVSKGHGSFLYSHDQT
jgi:AP-3 complex subunit beta